MKAPVVLYPYIKDRKHMFQRPRNMHFAFVDSDFLLRDSYLAQRNAHRIQLARKVEHR